MLDKLKLKIRYECESNVLIENDTCNNFEINKIYSGNRLQVALTAIKDIAQLYASLYCAYEYKETTRVFANGYQSWSTSVEYSPSDKQYGLRGLSKFGIGKKLAAPCGDYYFKNYSELEGDIHGYSYGYIRDDNNVKLIGSLSEREDFTVIFFKMHKNKLLLEKDFEGLSLKAGESIKLFDIAYFEGSYDHVFDEYFKLLNLPKRNFADLKGYTSWYNYFGKITQDILLRDLEGLSKAKDKANIFQIDDGYQAKVGDWLTLKDNLFPDGMKYIADKIHAKGMLAGIWLAPTLAAKNSDIVKHHPDWLVRDKSGKAVLGAIAWGGAYILDYHNQEVREYIKNVFDTVVNKWGYDMVKLDFLYSECLIPRDNKTRGQIMCETMDFLRECVGENKLILGCGVPLFPAFGTVDCCRIGCDVDIVYKDRFYVNNTNREVVNTKNAIINSVFRRHLDKRAFSNDPDVFFLRENVKFNHEQKTLLAKINNMFGSVLFVSDNVGDYDDLTLNKLLRAYEKSPITVTKAEFFSKTKIINIEYIQDDKPMTLKFNVANGKVLDK